MSYNVNVLCDSIANGQRIITASFTYPRFIHSEFLRHRMLSHSVESSRAVPTERMIDRVAEEPYVPETFNQRVKGMGVGKPFEHDEYDSCFDSWLKARDAALSQARRLNEIGLDKSRVNRLLEPFMFVTDLVTGTDWENFFALRDHEDAQPEFQIIARMARATFNKSEPVELEPDEWHLPLVRYDEFYEAKTVMNWEQWAKVSAGRCCRWSYGVDVAVAKQELYLHSLARADRLLESFHMSPFEHQARPFNEQEMAWVLQTEWLLQGNAPTEDAAMLANSLAYSGNLKYWHQFRQTFPNQENFAKTLSQQQ